jgi:hypothetical protein
LGTNILVNGNFDLGQTSGWKQVTSPALQQIVTQPLANIAPHSGTYFARVAHSDSESGWLYQTISIPANAVSLTLDGYYQVATKETSTQLDDAWFDLVLDGTVDPNGSYQDVYTKLWWNDDAPTTTWTHFSYVGDVTALAGQSIDFVLMGENDSTLPTDFYFDSLTLIPTLCQ